MIRSVILVLCSLIIFSNAFAQNTVQNEQNPIDKRKNAVYVSIDFVFTLAINYERLFPLSEKIDLGLRAGFGNDGGNKSLVAIGEGIFLYGNDKHFFEGGVGYLQPFHYFDEGPDSPLIALMAGYRYQSQKGFMLKIYPEYMIEISPSEDSWGNFPFIGLALGYSF